ncbi:hypothetical protein E2562_022302 [Oryza meyeriana var. granulata]|uniref:Uncharacterized protein n=1 Tax=Oryza meyeriana var. granulata TaxID=110450 RepID=A0A6G1D6G2_9ORYZ|nr:hypothetical protein E2562_022302 [Oryza meyeriana var. granulata]
MKRGLAGKGDLLELPFAEYIVACYAATQTTAPLDLAKSYRSLCVHYHTILPMLMIRDKQDTLGQLLLGQIRRGSSTTSCSLLPLSHHRHHCLAPLWLPSAFAKSHRDRPDLAKGRWVQPGGH